MSKDEDKGMSYTQKILIGLALAVLSPFAAKFGNGALGLFSTPGEIKATNARITRDSLIAAKQLRDSIAVYRAAFQNFRERLAEVEKENRQIKTKLKIR